MESTIAGGVALFRVWIGVFRGPAPADWHGLPDGLLALEPAEPGCLSADEAAVYVAAFNGALLDRPAPRHRRWAVPVPVRIRYEGDLRPGQRVGPQSVDFASIVRAAQEAAARDGPPEVG
jgi:hypothetical protein